MTHFGLLTLLYFLGHALDGATTYMCLFKLPKGREGTVLNPFAKDINKHFWKYMIWKLAGVLFVFDLILLMNTQERKLSLLLVLSIAMAFVIANNLVVYISRRRGDNFSVGGWIEKKLHVSQTVSFYIVALSYVGLSFGIVLAGGWWR